MKLIIGFYGSAFFAAGEYLKVVIDDNVGHYVEYIMSIKGNGIWYAEEYISSSEPLYDHERLIERYFFKMKYLINDISENVFKVLSSIDLEDFFSREYRESNILDGYGWKVHVNLNGKEYKTTGYENDPYEMCIIVNLLKDILLSLDPTIKFSSLQYIEI